MIRKIVEGATIGVGIVGVIALAFVIAWAGDVFTVDKDGTLKFAVNDQGKITVGATESYVNLVIQNNAAAANNKVDITADVLTVEGIRLENINVSTDITASGAGGLDTGAEAANTWYYVWAITNNTGSSTNGLLSISSTTPTMPSGYTKKRRISAVRNDGSSNFLQFVQEGNKVDYIETSGYSILSNGTATSYTAVSAAGFVPPTSRKVTLRHWILIRAASADVTFDSILRKTGSGVNEQAHLQARTQVANQSFVVERTDHVDINSSQQLDYAINSASSTARFVSLFVYGYYDRI